MSSSRKTGTSESIHSYGTAGAGRDYTALQTWEDAHTIDCVTGTTSPVLECYDDAASFNDYVTIAGATTNATYFRIIRPASGQGHDGTPNNGVTFICTTNADIFLLAESNSQVQDLIAKVNANSTNTRYSFATASGYSLNVFVGCIAYNCINAGTAAAGGYNLSSGVAIDCLAHNSEGVGFSSNSFQANNTIRFYNCEATNNGIYGFRMLGSQATGVHIYTNCLASGNTTADFSDGTTNSPTRTVTYSASGDTTADDWGGAGNHISHTFTFVNSGGDDFHLASNDVGAIDLGTDLSADGTYAFNDDIDKRTRTGTWDIGFDEYMLYEEVLTSLATSASSITDIQTFINIVSDQIIALDSLTEAQAYIKNLLSTLESVSVVEAIQTYVDTLASVAQSVSSLTDLQAYAIILADVAVSSSSITDLKAFIEIVQTIIVSSSSITDTIGLMEILVSTIQSSDSVTTVQVYFSSLLSTLVSLSSISDKQIYIHNLLTLIKSQVSIADQQAYIHGVQDLITSSSSITDVLTGPNAETLFDTILSQAGVYDYYQKPGMIETAPPFYLDPRPPEFQMGDAVPTFIIEKRKWT